MNRRVSSIFIINFTMTPVFHFIITLLLLSLTYSSVADNPLGNYCNQNTTINSTSSHPAAANIHHLLADVVTKFQQGTTFIDTSYGTSNNTVYGLAQCRGDLGSKDCLGCIQDAAQQVQILCPGQSDARIWYDFCFLRYSQVKFFGNVDTSPGILYKNVANVTNPDIFDQDLGRIFEEISSKAVKPLSGGIGKGKKELSNFEMLYALVQCTRDLTPVSCGQCLALAIHNFEGFCRNSIGCSVLYGSCYVRYELYPFFFSIDDVSSKIGNRRI